MGEYDQYRAVGACYYRGELAFAPGQPIPASHPRLSRWLSDGLAVSTGATTTRAVTARALLSLRTRAGKVGHVDVPAAPSFDVAAWSTGAAVAAAAAPVAKPSGTVAGDLLLAVHTCDPNGNLAGMTAPDGSWSPAGTGGSSPSGFGKVWTKVAGSSEPDGYTFNGPAGGASGVEGVAGIVTGRALADLRPRLAFVPDYLIGNHGLEGVPGALSASAAVDVPARVARWKAQLEPELAALDPGIYIEDKHFSLSLHYLHARDPAQAARALRERIAAMSPPPRVIGGKCLLNVLPADVGDKGSAVRALLASAGIAQALYVGDDQTDEDVFRLSQPGLFTVHVGHDDDSAARWRLHEQRDVERLLDWLLAAMPAGHRDPASTTVTRGGQQ